jgi:RNA polymerase sigma factor (sigma-70 family)
VRAREGVPPCGIFPIVATTATGIRAARELDELYRAHAAEVYRYAYAVLGNAADAEDVMQTTFVNALRALERGEKPRKPTNWLITIAHNLIRQRFRQQQSRPHEVELDRDIASFEADDDGPSIDDLVRALQRIPPTQREALVLRELEGRSYKEIASILDVSPTALETLIFRARRSLAEELENLVTCDRAELALSQQTDGRLGRKERKRLVAHLDECPSCARVAAAGLKRRRAFKGLAILPLPLSLTLFKGAPSASAAVGLSAIGGGAAVGGGAVGGGVAAKVAIAVVAVTVAGGAGYEGVQQTREPATPARAVAAKVAPAKAASAKAVAAKVARVKQLPGKVAAKKADHATAKAAKPVSKAGTATKRARTPVPTGRPASSRSETAKLPGNNGRDESAPGLKKALGKTKRPLEGEAEPGKSGIAKLRPSPPHSRSSAKPLREQPVRAKVAKPKLKPRQLIPLDRGRASKN